MRNDVSRAEVNYSCRVLNHTRAQRDACARARAKRVEFAHTCAHNTTSSRGGIKGEEGGGPRGRFTLGWSREHGRYR